jgi:hypothetical protein
METQNVPLDSAGGYMAQIGATKSEGLPIELFASGEARWLEVQVDGQPAAQRILLVSVPYALKAVDAQTLGGLPASAYALAATSGTSGTAAPASGAAAISPAPRGAKSGAIPAATTVTGAGTAGYIPLWNGASTLTDSAIVQKSGSLGIGVTPSTEKLGVSSSTGNGINGISSSTSGTGVEGQATATSGTTNGVLGTSASTGGAGVEGQATASSGTTYGVYGTDASSTGTGVLGQATAGSGITTGVVGIAKSTSGAGVSGTATATSGSTYGVYANDASTAGYAVYGTNTATTGTTYGVYGTDASINGYGVYGANTATSGVAAGVYGTTASSAGAAIWALNPATTGGYAYGIYSASNSSSGVGVSGQALSTSGNTYGIAGEASSSTGVGVAGYGTTLSSLGSSFVGSGAGVWGDTANGTYGVLATAVGHEAVAAYSNATNVATMFVENQEDTNSSSTVFATFSDYGGFCDIFVNGNLTCSGSVGGHAVVGQSQEVALYSVQAADNWMEDAGSSQLHNGAALVTLDATYAQTVNTGMDYHVFLTPNGDCKGLYVTKKSPTSFEVHELGGGTSSVAFDYRIMARRSGFENIRLADMTGKIQKDTRLKHASGETLVPPPPGAALQHAPAAAPAVRPVISPDR